MLLQVKTHAPARRSGIVLLVVMAMLALFATVALSFVFYSEAEAIASRYAAQAYAPARADIDPELLGAYFLGQLIYDTDNPFSAMRGHSFARNMYGQSPDGNSVVPYSGVGRLRFDMPHNKLDGKDFALVSLNNMVLVNYTNFSGNPAFVREPERDANNNYVSGSVHWTYPDLNNLYLSAINGNGEVLIPSFSRPWMQIPPLVTTPVNVIHPWASYLTMR